MNIITENGSAKLDWKGGYGTLIIAGDFAGGSVKVEGDYGVDELIPIKDISGDPFVVDSNTATNFLSAPCEIKVTHEGSSGNPNLKFSLRIIPISVAQRY